MRRTGIVITVLILSVLFPVTQSQGDSAAGCIGLTICELGDRSYHVLPPDGWDGKTPLPVLMHFHGWKRQGDTVVKHGRIAAATRSSGVLLVAPNGLGRTWDFWQSGSPDTRFANAVLAAVERRFPVDASRIFVSGYSWGSSMAWRYACESGRQITVLLGISGTFYDQNEECESGPQEVRHVHGTSDTVMDFPYGPNGEETYPVYLWRKKNVCKEAPDSVTNWNVNDKDLFKRYVWENCNSGKTVTLDVHSRGHFIPVGWIQRQLDEILDQRAAH